MSNHSKIDLLKIIDRKFDSEREVLMDSINTSLSSSDPNRVENIYTSILALATIDKAIELNRYFQLQIQEQTLEKVLSETNNSKK